VFVHQFTYTKRVLKKFNMSKCHPLKTPIEADKDSFRPKGDDEEVLGPKVWNCTRPDIVFTINLLARYGIAPTKRHWVGIKTILRYLQGTQDLGLWFLKNQAPTMVRYIGSGCMSDPHNTRSPTGFVFLCDGATISWWSVK
jgi:hypothetical protein